MELLHCCRLLDSCEFHKAILYFEKFIITIKKKPQLKKLLWLSWSIYTPDVLAMTENNLGVRRLELGEIDAAKRIFERIIEKDPEYPIPYFNLAIVQEIQGENTKAVESIGKAVQLGYTQGSIDKVISKGQSLLAIVEG